MKLINKSKLFSIFSKDKQEKTNNQEIFEKEVKYLESFYEAIIGVMNYEYLDEVYSNRSPVYQKIKHPVKINYFNKMFNYVVESNFKEKEVINIVTEDLGETQVNKAINTLLTHFIEVEEYEKCAVLQEVLDFQKKK